MIRIQDVVNISENISVMVFIGWYYQQLPEIHFIQIILEVYFIKIMVPSLNSQMNNDALTIFRKGVT